MTGLEKRNKVKKACDSCRRRKRGCDGSQPCGSCSQAGVSCTYNTTWASHPARKSPPPTGHGDIRRSMNDEIRFAQRADSTTSEASRPHASGLVSARKSAARHSSPTLSGNHVGAGVIAEDTPRFVQRTSAIAFPRLLGLELKAPNPPKLHSFAYNLGHRQEEKSIDYGVLPVSLDHVREYAETFFRLPLIMMDRELFDRMLTEYIQSPRPSLGSVIGGIFALGSCNSNRGHPAERDVVAWCKSCLEDPSITRRPSVEAIIGWTLRSWYLRFTTRPNCVWIASCTTVHLMESIGLHRQENIQRLAEFSSIDEGTLRLLFWNMWAVHRMVCLEYGRSHIELPVTTRRIESRFLDIVMSDDLSTLDTISVNDPLMVLTKGDVACALFRRAWITKTAFSEPLLLKIGGEALDAAEGQCIEPNSMKHFTTLGSAFQFTCVLIALRTQKAQDTLPRAFQVLELIAERIDTNMARDALATANLLLGCLIESKRGELNELDALFTKGLPTPASISPDFLEFDWTQFDSEFGLINTDI